MYSARIAGWVSGNLLAKRTLSGFDASADFFHSSILDLGIFLGWPAFFGRALVAGGGTGADNGDTLGGDGNGCGRTGADVNARPCEDVRDDDCSDLMFSIKGADCGAELVVLHLLGVFGEAVILGELTAVN